MVACARVSARGDTVESDLLFGAYAKFPKVSISVIMSVRPHCAPTGRILIKFNILVFFEYICLYKPSFIKIRRE